MRKVWQYNVDLLKLNNEISEFQWESYLKECTDIDIMSSSFTQKCHEIISRNIPSKMISHGLIPISKGKSVPETD